MESTDNELEVQLEEQLMEAGNKLLNPPSSVDELLPLLDQVENYLSKVEQSPAESMQKALDPSLKALVADQLFRHTDVDVKVAVASCISEITRITAPDAPYNDDQMKDVFRLIVSSFENLADKSSRSFGKRTMILETVAKVRSCVVMLDLECDALIIEMFQLFLNSIRNYHPESVFSCMETIMTLVLEESEDVSVELLSPLLASVKRDNEEVLPIAQKLGEKVLENCASKVKPYLAHAVKSLGLSVGDYTGVVASICPELSGTIQQNDSHAADENKQIGTSADETAQADKDMIVGEASDKRDEPANDGTPKPAVSNGVSQSGEDDKLEDSNSLKKHEEENHADEQKHVSTNAEQQNVDVEMVDTESNPELTAKKKGKKVTISKKPIEPSESSQIDAEEGKELPHGKINAKDVSDSPHEDPSADAAASSKNKKDTDAVESKSGTVLSPSISENLPDESLSKKGGRSKKKESLIKDSAPSGDDVPERVLEEGSDSEAKMSKRHGKKVAVVISGEDKTPPPKDSSKKERSNTSKSEEKSLKQFSKKSEAGSTNGDQSSLKHSEDKKRGSRGKAVSESDGIKSSTKDDNKEKISSLKSSSKSTKDVQVVKETPTSVPKRKHTPDVSKDYGEEVVGVKVKVWWPQDRQFYKGKIQAFDPDKKKHKVVYNDGDVEVLNLKRQRFEFIRSDTESDEEETDDSSQDAASDMPLKKKAKTNPDHSKKQAKMDASPKQSIGASSSKAKTAIAKSGQKLKESIKTDGKSLDDSKSSRKTEDDTGAKSKDHNPKTGSKSTTDASKSAGKSKNEDRLSKSKEDNTSTPKVSKPKQEAPKSSKAKQDSSKASPISKGKPIKSGGKSNVNGGKQKSGSSKDKVEEDEDNSTDSGEAPEVAKRKVTSSSKGQGSEVRSGKKRRRGA